MLTITTNKETVQGIVAGRIREHSLPVTEYWTKRILKLLDVGGDEKTILRNLADGKAGAADAEREVTFTAGGVASATVTVTVSIGVVDQIRREVGIAEASIISSCRSARSSRSGGSRTDRSMTAGIQTSKSSVCRTRPPSAL